MLGGRRGMRWKSEQRSQVVSTRSGQLGPCFHKSWLTYSDLIGMLSVLQTQEPRYVGASGDGAISRSML